MALLSYTQISEQIGMVTLTDPGSLNSMSEQMADEFFAITKQLQNDLKTRVLYITGEGRAFSSGGTLSMLEEKISKTAEENKTGMLSFYNRFLSILNVPQITIALINGSCIGAALCFSCACDIRIAATEAKLGVTFSKIGLYPGMGATFFLPKLLGKSRALELLLSGKVLTAIEAHEIGLVSSVVPLSELQKAGADVATQLLSASGETQRALLKNLRVNAEELQKALNQEATEQSVSYASVDFKERLSALTKK